MGYSTVSTSMFSPDIKQTPENVAKVLDIAGWTVAEAAVELHIREIALDAACNSKRKLPESVWMALLDKAGRRAFDAGCDE